MSNHPRGKHGFRKSSFVEALAANCTDRQIDRTPTHKYADTQPHIHGYGQQLDVAKCNLLISRPLQGGRGSMVERVLGFRRCESAGHVRTDRLSFVTGLIHYRPICCGWIPDPDPSILLNPDLGYPRLGFLRTKLEKVHSWKTWNLFRIK